MNRNASYTGIDNDRHGGMTSVGNILRDAWMFGLLPEEERCEGWSYDRMEQLYDRVSRAWEPYGHLVSQLPPELRERHQRIYDQAVQHARAVGWDPELGDDD